MSTDDPETAVAKADDPKDSYVVAESLEKSRDTDNGGDVNSQRCEKAEKKLSQCPYGKRCYRYVTINRSLNKVSSSIL